MRVCFCVLGAVHASEKEQLRLRSRPSTFTVHRAIVKDDRLVSIGSQEGPAPESDREPDLAQPAEREASSRSRVLFHIHNDNKGPAGHGQDPGELKQWTDFFKSVEGGGGAFRTRSDAEDMASKALAKPHPDLATLKEWTRFFKIMNGGGGDSAKRKERDYRKRLEFQTLKQRADHALSYPIRLAKTLRSDRRENDEWWEFAVEDATKVLSSIAAAHPAQRLPDLAEFKRWILYFKGHDRTWSDAVDMASKALAKPHPDLAELKRCTLFFGKEPTNQPPTTWSAREDMAWKALAKPHPDCTTLKEWTYFFWDASPKLRSGSAALQQARTALQAQRLRDLGNRELAQRLAELRSWHTQFTRDEGVGPGGGEVYKEDDALEKAVAGFTKEFSREEYAVVLAAQADVWSDIPPDVQGLVMDFLVAPDEDAGDPWNRRLEFRPWSKQHVRKGDAAFFGRMGEAVEVACKDYCIACNNNRTIYVNRAKTLGDIRKRRLKQAAIVGGSIIGVGIALALPVVIPAVVTSGLAMGIVLGAPAVSLSSLFGQCQYVQFYSMEEGAREKEAVPVNGTALPQACQVFKRASFWTKGPFGHKRVSTEKKACLEQEQLCGVEGVKEIGVVNRQAFLWDPLKRKFGMCLRPQVREGRVV